MVKEWNFFQKNDFHVEKNFVGKMYREIVLHGGTNDQIVLRGKEFHKIYFLVIWTVQIWKNFLTIVEYSLEDKALIIL